MPLTNDSNFSVIQSVFYSSGVIISVSLLLFLQLLIVREINLIRQRRQQRFITLWQPLLISVAFTQPDKLPRLKNKEQLFFINEWNQIFNRLNGKARDRLIVMANEVNIKPFVHKLLYAKRSHLRLLGITTIGHLRDTTVWTELEHITQEENPTISLAAMRALIQIDAERSIRIVIDIISQRHDWPSAYVANILREAGPHLSTLPLTQATEKADDADIPYLMQFFSYIHASKARLTIDHILKKSVDDRVIAACLQATNDARLLKWVREYVDYPRWHVRVHAATALGRLGKQKDLPLLVSLLTDKAWWVRYRAAQAITHLSFVETDQLNRIKDRQTDPFARDIMAQVIAEKALS